MRSIIPASFLFLASVAAADPRDALAAELLAEISPNGNAAVARVLAELRQDLSHAELPPLPRIDLYAESAIGGLRPDPAQECPAAAVC